MSLEDRLYVAAAAREVWDTGVCGSTRDSFDMAKLSPAEVLRCLRAEVEARLWESLSPRARARREAALQARCARKQSRLADREARRREAGR